ncbi:MAG: bifunctional phosphopantothenoylcysteine decarboxylase/phosphopantothenate--cysteine ligase CoaBC [Reichenbachiella sp.]
MEGKNILIGVCGSIAAYKSAHLVRLLIKKGCNVKVIMTDSAKGFITPLTLSTLSKNPVLSKFERNEQGEWENHVSLGQWADLMIIAPASANTIAKMATGLCDNLLSAVYLSAKCPVMVAPAMDLDMYKHPATNDNLQKLSTYGNTILEAEHGELASGLVGEGRMMEPESILDAVDHFLSKKKRFEGVEVVITAGPTFEKIDPVRFIGNHSSGKMGLALAKTLSEEGANVKLIAGPGVEKVTNKSIEVTRVGSADEMFDVTNKLYASSEIAIFAAAVADYKPKIVASQKIKKSDQSLTLELVKNKDIAAELGKVKTANQINVGFALETENETENALAKLKKKNLDFIILNSLNDKGAGFSADTNKITIFNADQKSIEYPLKNKMEVATDIVDAIYEKHKV